jgi:hypothetical protein
VFYILLLAAVLCKGIVTDSFRPEKKKEKNLPLSMGCCWSSYTKVFPLTAATADVD